MEFDVRNDTVYMIIYPAQRMNRRANLVDLVVAVLVVIQQAFVKIGQAVYLMDDAIFRSPLIPNRRNPGRADL